IFAKKIFMPRPQKCRKVHRPPQMIGFMPYGIENNPLEHIDIHYEEYEAIRLVNYEKLSQEEAAVRMEVSRPTLTRIYNSALNKIAQALVEGKSLIIDGGNFVMPKEWYKCRKCYKLVEGIENHTPCVGCCEYGENELIKL
ncbi:MAG: DUF134 domain-containing protein, partial [Bacteroidales bacterium]